MLFRKFIEEEGKTVRKLFERNAAVTWFNTTGYLRELTDKFIFDTEFSGWYFYCYCT